MTKQIKIIILIIVVLLILGIVFFIFGRPQVKKGEVQIDKEILETGYPKEYNISKKAVTEKNTDYCLELRGEEQDNCILAVATVNNESKFCQEIENEDLKKQCQELFIYRQASADKNVSSCLTVENEGYKNQCLKEVFRQYDNLNQCQNPDQPLQDLCESIVYSKIAFTQEDVEVCKKIKDPDIKASCLIVVSDKPKDSDKDGLLDMEERNYGLDPLNPDTDGDGFSDGEEIKAGTDPLDPQS